MCARRKAADKKKVLFSDEFYSDMSAPDMLHAVLVRSPFSYGKITSIHFAPRTKIPAGYELFTYKDIPGKKLVHILETNVPLLCTGEISYKGEILAVITGENKEILEELKSAVRIELEKSSLEENESKFAKAYRNLSVSLKDGSLIEQSVASLRNTLADFSNPRDIIAKRKFSVGDVDSVFGDEEKAAFTVEGIWKNGMGYHSNKETEGCLCYIRGGNLNIITPTQWISGLRKTVCDATGFPADKIIITRTKVSVKTTNSLFMNGILASITAIAAFRTGKPVKLVLTRKEHEELFESPPEVKISHKTALDKNGTITAMDISLEYDAGSYNPFAQEILDRLSISATGIYNCKNVRVNAKAYRSHQAPSAFHLSMIDSYSFFAIENQIQKIAGQTAFSSVELRQMNKAGGIQKNTLPFTYSFGRASDAINAVAIRSDFRRKYAVSRLAEHRRFEGEENMPYSPPLRGIALACAFDGSGYLGPNFEKSNISMQISVTEEKKIIVNAFPPSQSIREIWTKIIMENLDTDKRSITFTTELAASTEKKKENALMIPDTLIGTVSMKTILLEKCVDAIKRKKLSSAPFSVKKTFGTAKKQGWNQETFSGSPYYNASFGSCTVELELDSCTYQEHIRKICVIIDGGRILNPKAAENAVRRSIQRCLSMLIEDETHICPSISVQFTQSNEEPKQIGHLVYSMLPAAFSSALSQALAVPIQNLPLQSDSIYKITEAAK